MKKDKVPQDPGMLDGEKELCYALGEDGHYTTVQSSGWEVKNLILKQAWDKINQEIVQILDDIRNGETSPLAYHMARNLMDVKLLAQYSNLPKRKVKRHLRKRYFEELDSDTLNTYAGLFKISVDELKKIPNQDEK